MEEFIEKIGNDLVKCSLKCEGIINEPKKGIPPRCLILENRKGTRGAVVVGLNPGSIYESSYKRKELERKFYLEKGCSYESIKEWWNKIKDVPYFRRVRDLLDLLGFDGPIIWTDLVKCESNRTYKRIPVQTMRVCIDIFLRREIENYPKYAIIANGNEAFKFCSLSFPKHFVIGVPHSSGSYGDFINLLKAIKNSKEKYLKIINEEKDDNGNIKAVFLKP